MTEEMGTSRRTLFQKFPFLKHKGNHGVFSNNTAAGYNHEKRIINLYAYINRSGTNQEMNAEAQPMLNKHNST